MRKKYLKLYDIEIEGLYNIFPKARYVDLKTEEPLTELLLYEVEHLLSKITFSKKRHLNNKVKLIVFLHCLGYSDKQISDGFLKMLIFMTPDAVKKSRQRALEKINIFFGSEIGFITIMYETFKNFEFLG